MREVYDAAVAKWNRDTVPYHNHQHYGDYFGRSTLSKPAKRRNRDQEESND